MLVGRTLVAQSPVVKFAEAFPQISFANCLTYMLPFRARAEQFVNKLRTTSFKHLDQCPPPHCRSGTYVRDDQVRFGQCLLRIFAPLRGRSCMWIAQYVCLFLPIEPPAARNDQIQMVPLHKQLDYHANPENGKKGKYLS